MYPRIMGMYFYYKMGTYYKMGLFLLQTGYIFLLQNEHLVYYKMGFLLLQNGYLLQNG